MSSETASKGGLPTVEILMPATWHELDLDPKTRVASIARLVERTTKPGPQFDQARRRARTELEGAARVGVAGGAVLAFIYWFADDAGIASASLYVSMVDPLASEGAQPPPDQRSVAAAIAELYGGELLELPVGPAARVRRRGQLSKAAPDAADRGAAPEAEILTWYVPHESAQRIAVLTFSTPNMEAADAFDEVFDAIASTVRWIA
jgi:hypothetical protein